MHISNPLELNSDPAPPIEAPKYCLYARKSSESDEKQALSIDSQIKEMLQLAQRDGIEVTEIKRESHSAKETAQRPVFNEMIRQIKEGRFGGILAWHPDRLSRNAGDLGSIVDLMDQHKLIEVKTYGQRFTNSPSEKFLLMILCSQAKLDNDNKSVNVKRGLRTRIEMGLWPSVAPTGYLNHPDRTKKCHVILDPQRSHVIKIMFEKVAYEKWSGRALYRWLKDDLKFRTKSGKPFTLSNVHTVLRNPFYCGLLEYPRKSGRWNIGRHESIISQELFKKVQEKLDSHKPHGPAVKEFAFTRLMKCGICNSGITAQEKFKNLKDGSTNSYIYYGCTRFYDKSCKNTYLREDSLVEQLLAILDKIQIDKIGIKEKLEKEMGRFSNFRNNVLGLTEDQITDQSGLDLRSYAKYILKKGTVAEKRELMQSFKSKLTLINKKVLLENPS
ncbi:MAG: recombinase family protein [Candidatus Yonathbacteria bacterium]|nr:recombinase family protein [Candidatus Yonathbacteria bacterium]NTW47433.1 recombinase family protein [Candidatus Yonathbacteria bacterium]